MTTFSTTETKPVNTVFRLPVDTSTGPKGLFRSGIFKNRIVCFILLCRICHRKK